MTLARVLAAWGVILVGLVAGLYAVLFTVVGRLPK